jgi:peptide/nickel transport system permease protein
MIMTVSAPMKDQVQEQALDDEILSGGESVYVAPPWKLMWWRFRKHKMAMVSAVILLAFYFTAAFCEFVAPYDPDKPFIQYKYSPATRIHLRDAEGRFRAPFVYQTTRGIDPVTAQPTYVEDMKTRYTIQFFVQGFEYKLFGLIPAKLHLFGVPSAGEKQGVFLFGADRLGRDMFSRIAYGARLSLSLGLVGVFLSLVLGVILGGVSGYFGGWIDTAVQRTIEFIRTIPTIPLWMTLSAALPADWPVTRVYFGITVILSLVGWTFMARVVRGRFLAMREEDFVLAARLNGAREMRIIVRHMVPSFLSYIIAALTLAIPGMILAETGLSFLGLGLRPPAISWGVLLQEAMNLRSLVLAPWVLWPGAAVVISVLAFNFVGDGMRDAADPYAR